MKGWIKLHRKLQDHPFYTEKRKFSKLEAWIDILLSANHKDNRFLLGNKWIEVERGSFITSEQKLMKKWNWSKTKVRAFLKLLEDEKMITKKSDHKKTTLTVCNYCVYQDFETTEKPQKNHKKTSKRPVKDPNNNDKNDKNEKNDNKSNKKKEPKINYAEFVKMTEKEYQTLVEQFGEADTLKMIDILDNYKGSKGKTYKSDYRAILSWVVKRLNEEKIKQPNIPRAFQSLQEWGVR